MSPAPTAKPAAPAPSATDVLEAPVTLVPGVSAKTAATLQKAFGITTLRDLVEHYPVQDKYRDLGAVVEPSLELLGEQVTVVGEIAGWQVNAPQRRGGTRNRRSTTVSKARLRTGSGTVVEVAFFNQPWRPGKHPRGTTVAVAGLLERFRGQLQVRNPQIIDVDDGDTVAHEARIVSTYPATERLSSTRIAALVHAALDLLPDVPDFLPDHLRDRDGFLGLDHALRTLHQPRSLAAPTAARERLVYDELLTLQIGLQRRRHRMEADEAGVAQPPVDDGLVTRLETSLPFVATAAQARAFAEIDRDLTDARPMHRLLQGDVGSGKTLVAAHAMLTAVDNGRQAALMVPTEVLAEQHARTFRDLLAPLGLDVLDGPRLAVVTGSTPTGRLRGILAELASGDIDLVIGTHALLEPRVLFADLGLVVVDEQHRFGVRHRARLKDKRVDGRSPDVLVMTATPIPRSLALTVYGDLELTTLDELPPGRQPVTTTVLPTGSPRRARLYSFVRERIASGERAYVVCPLVADSDALDVAAAETTFAHLASGAFSDCDVVLVHGQLSSADKDAAMQAFASGAAQVMVATTVIEVGVDVPAATVMIVEDADRFGLSQLHQLRGRIGRGAARSYCVLFSREPDGNQRLAALAATSDGFELARTDLRLRGEGSLFDTRQSGLPDLKLAQLVRDQRTVERTRDDARALIADDPALSRYPALAAEVRRRYGQDRLAELETS